MALVRAHNQATPSPEVLDPPATSTEERVDHGRLHPIHFLHSLTSSVNTSDSVPTLFCLFSPASRRHLWPDDSYGAGEIAFSLVNGVQSCALACSGRRAGRLNERDHLPTLGQSQSECQVSPCRRRQQPPVSRTCILIPQHHIHTVIHLHRAVRSLDHAFPSRDLRLRSTPTPLCLHRHPERGAQSRSVANKQHSVTRTSESVALSTPQVRRSVGVP